MNDETQRVAAGHDSQTATEGAPVRHRFRSRLTYANVMSTLAVFIALGGSSYAAVSISGSSLKHRSVSGTKLKRNTLTGAEVRESRLRRVPHARLADRLGPRATKRLKVHCPPGTVLAASTCVEVAPRGKAQYGGAVDICSEGSLRRLPTHNELRAALRQDQVQFTGPEITSDVYPSTARPGELDVLYFTNREGAVGITTNTVAGATNFRCAVDPSN